MGGLSATFPVIPVLSILSVLAVGEGLTRIAVVSKVPVRQGSIEFTGRKGRPTKMALRSL
jgi:hypothetical protein